MKTKKERSKKSEIELAESLEGRRQPASGALPVASLKGDVRSRFWLIDDKITSLKSFSIGVKTWRKIRKQAWQNHRRPAISVNFADEVRLFVIDEQAFHEYNNFLNSQESLP